MPNAPERAYERELVAISRAMVADLKTMVNAYLARARERERSDADVPLDLLAVDVGSARARLHRIARGRGQRAADRFATSIDRWNAAETKRLLAIESPAELAPVLATLRNINVQLITSIADRLLNDVRETITEAVARGTRVEVLAARLQERYAVSDSRARLIARDQTLKANADLTRERQKRAGVERYVWSTSRDERVRDTHAALEGEIFSWDSPPDPGHPGQDYQCRCVAIGVLDRE